MAEAGGILQLRVHLSQQLAADAELPRRFAAMEKIPPFSGHGTCIKINGQGARDADGQRGDLYVVLNFTAAEALTSSNTPAPPPHVRQHNTPALMPLMSSDVSKA